jgi:hypothetical protein
MHPAFSAHLIFVALFTLKPLFEDYVSWTKPLLFKLIHLFETRRMRTFAIIIQLAEIPGVARDSR